MVLKSFTAQPQNQISGKCHLSQCEDGIILKCKFDKIKGACVHQCSCVFTINWKHPNNVMSFCCLCSGSDRYVICFVKQGHYTWTTQILVLIILIKPDVVGLLTSWPKAMCDFCSIPCRGCFVAHVSCHISILCSKSTFLTNVSLGSVIDLVTKRVLLVLVNQVFLEDIANLSLVRIY